MSMDTFDIAGLVLLVVLLVIVIVFEIAYQRSPPNSLLRQPRVDGTPLRKRVVDETGAAAETPRIRCIGCGRDLATYFDEEACNTGECGCPTARALCWRPWNGDKCLPRSIYDTRTD
ncbi:MAG: hypothetical protein ACHREM_08770 [Polyangiales bacterium]